MYICLQNCQSRQLKKKTFKLIYLLIFYLVTAVQNSISSKCIVRHMPNAHVNRMNTKVGYR